MWKIFGKRRSYARNLKNCQELEFLPYHRLGLHAYRSWEETINRRTCVDEPLGCVSEMGFLCETDWMFDIAISGLEVYKAGIGKTGVTEEVLKA